MQAAFLRYTDKLNVRWNAATVLADIWLAHRNCFSRGSRNIKQGMANMYRK